MIFLAKSIWGAKDIKCHVGAWETSWRKQGHWELSGYRVYGCSWWLLDKWMQKIEGSLEIDDWRGGGRGCNSILCSKSSLTALYDRRNTICWVKEFVVRRLLESCAVVIFQLQKVNLCSESKVWEHTIADAQQSMWARLSTMWSPLGVSKQ